MATQGFARYDVEYVIRGTRKTRGYGYDQVGGVPTGEMGIPVVLPTKLHPIGTRDKTCRAGSILTATAKQPPLSGSSYPGYPPGMLPGTHNSS